MEVAVAVSEELVVVGVARSFARSQPAVSIAVDTTAADVRADRIPWRRRG